MGLIQKILAKVEEDAKHEARKPHTIGVYRSSEVGGCRRALQYARLGYTAEPLTPETHLIFLDGHLHHQGVRQLLARVGTLTHVEMDVSKQYKHKGQKFLVTGHIDQVFDHKQVQDTKSISTFMFKKLDKDFPDLYMKYIYQVNLYMDMIDLDEGAIIFKDKNSAELKIFEFDRDEVLLNQILDHIAEIHKATKEKKLLDRPFERNSWECKSCQYRLPCWNLPMEGKRWDSGFPMRRQASKVPVTEDLKQALRETLKQGKKTQERSS